MVVAELEVGRGPSEEAAASLPVRVGELTPPRKRLLIAMGAAGGQICCVRIAGMERCFGPNWRCTPLTGAFVVSRTPAQETFWILGVRRWLRRPRCCSWSVCSCDGGARWENIFGEGSGCWRRRRTILYLDKLNHRMATRLPHRAAILNV